MVPKIRKEDVFIRFSDLHINVPYHMIIPDLYKYEFYKEAFILYEAVFQFHNGPRPIKILFPKWKFRHAYTLLDQDHRLKIGRYNVFIEFYKRAKGVLEFTVLETWDNSKKEEYFNTDFQKPKDI